MPREIKKLRMFQTGSRFLTYCLTFALVLFILASCKPPQRTAYFQDVPDSISVKKILQTIPPEAAVVRTATLNVMSPVEGPLEGCL